MAADDVSRSVLNTALSAAVSGAVGFLAALTTFQTRIARLEDRGGEVARKTDLELLTHDLKLRREMIDARLAAQDAAIDRLSERVDKRCAQIDRRQLVQLELLADIARKIGADGRVTDLMTRFLSDAATNTDEHERLR